MGRGGFLRSILYMSSYLSDIVRKVAAQDAVLSE